MSIKRKHNFEINVSASSKVLTIDLSANKDRIALLERCCELLNVSLEMTKKQLEMKSATPSYDQLIKFFLKHDMHFFVNGETKQLTTFCDVVTPSPASFVSEPHKTPETKVDVVVIDKKEPVDSIPSVVDLEDEDDEDPFS